MRVIDEQEFDGPRPIQREELAAAHRLDALCFPGFVEEIDEQELLASCIPPRRGGLQVICHRGAPICQIGITHGRVSMYGSDLRIASIGSVCTHPDYRGQGLAGRLLEYCMQKLKADGARLALISAVRSLYTRAGCVPAMDLNLVRLEPGQPLDGLRDLLLPRTSGLSFRPMTEVDVALCARLYQMEPVHFVRGVEDFTEHFSHLEEFPQAEDWIFEVEGRPVAYAILSLPWEVRQDPGAGLREVFEYAGSRVALVAGLAEVVARQGLQEMRLLVPWQDVDFLQLLRGQGFAGEHVPLEHTMRVVDFAGLMSDLRRYVSARLTARQRRGLRFEQEGDRYGLARGRERLELDGVAMTRLVMGAPLHMMPNVPLESGTLGEIVQILFPLPSFLPGLNYR
jgi:GNAT superfamily N-acetyltransferase